MKTGETFKNRKEGRRQSPFFVFGPECCVPGSGGEYEEVYFANRGNQVVNTGRYVIKRTPTNRTPIIGKAARAT